MITLLNGTGVRLVRIGKRCRRLVGSRVDVGDHFRLAIVDHVESASSVASNIPIAIAIGARVGAV